MVGIAGFFRNSVDPDATLQQMVRCMAHAPSYRTGVHSEPAQHAHVAWALHSDGPFGAPLVWNAARDIGLVLSGEIFSSESAHGARGTSGVPAPLPPRQLLEFYARVGVDCFSRLNGIFSGVIIDRRSQNAHLFNDRFGLARIYLLEQPEGTLFASEAKSLLCVSPGARGIDDRALGELISLGCVLQNRTLFAGVTLLPPGSCWSFDRSGAVSRRRYFVPEEWESQEPIAAADYYDALKERFVGLLPRYLAGDQPIGVSLTGGIDSRMIMSWARPLPGSLQCYTFAGTYRECADVRIARKLAQLCHQPHQTIVAGPDLLREFPSLAEQAIYLSDGTMDVTGAVELYVNRKARQIAPLRLTGNYGSEIVRGNVAFRPRAVPELALRPEVVRATRAAAETYAAERACHPVTFIAFKQVPWHHYARLSVEQSQLTLRSPYLDNDLVSLMYRVPQSLVTDREPSLRLCFDGNPALDALGTDRGFRYRRRPLIDGFTRAAIEFTVKAEYAYDYGMPQWLARLDHHLAALRLERLLLGRQKFYHFRVWYRDALAGHLKEVLLDPKTLARSPYDPRSLRAMVESHAAGRANFTLDLHRALGVELTYRQLIDRW